MDKIFYRRSTNWLVSVMLGALAAAGCRQVSAPIHVWVPPRFPSAVGSKVAISPVIGDASMANALQTQMLALAPRDAGRALVCVDARSLQKDHGIRLVSDEEGEGSDIANLSLARRHDADYLLTGEVVRQPSEVRSELHRAIQGLGALDNAIHQQPSNQITVSWKLTDLRGQSGTHGFPVVTKYDAFLDLQGIANAAAQDAWKLITPNVIADSVTLATPRTGLASGNVRSGNEAAIAGDWVTAQEIWNQVLMNHPRNHAAMHNLAVAAVARQDYDSATRLIGSALRTANKPLYRETAVWIEAKQRDYHQAFELPDPPTGWSAIRR
jgi:hypothetical protein